MRHAFSLGEKERKLVTARYQSNDAMLSACCARHKHEKRQIRTYMPAQIWLIIHVRANHPQRLNCRQFIWGQPRKSTHTLVDTPRYRTQNKKLVSQVDRCFDKNVGKRAYVKINVRTTSSPKLMGLAGRHVHSVNVTDAQTVVDTLSETRETRRLTHSTPRTARLVRPTLSRTSWWRLTTTNQQKRPTEHYARRVLSGEENRHLRRERRHRDGAPHC